jgi:hypothetical protein
LVEIGVGQVTACYTIGAVICSFPRASFHSGARFDLSARQLRNARGQFEGNVTRAFVRNDAPAGFRMTAGRIELAGKAPDSLSAATFIWPNG